MQPGPVSDSSNRDAFEAVVELYYQTNGYITSSGKRFRVWEAGEKKRRGFQEIIDVLAINDRETVIVRVSSNLDDPLRFGEHPLDFTAKLKSTTAYFERVTRYLKSVDQYAWMVAEKKCIRKVIAYSHKLKNASGMVIPLLGEHGIEVLSAAKVLDHLRQHVEQPHLRVQDQILRTLQLLGGIEKK